MTYPSFDASLAGKSKRRIRGMLIVLLAFMITVAAVVADVVLRHVVDESKRAEVLLLQLHASAYRLSAFEWQAISEGEMSAKIIAGVRDAQDAMKQTMGSLEQLDPDAGTLRSVRQAYDTYSRAIDEEFRLLKAGDLSQARHIDEELVDPAFDALAQALSSTGAAYRSQANRIERMAFLGSTAVFLLAIVTIGVLVWRTQKAQAATEVATVEQEALIRGQAELRLFADNVPSMTASFDENLRCVFANRRYADFFGLDKANIIGKHVREILGEKVYGEVASQFAQVLQGRPVTYQRTFELQDGARRYLEVRLAPDIGREGKVAGCFAVAHDTTERKETEGRIVHLNRVYAVLSGINALIVRVVDRDELFRGACRIAVEAGGFRLAWLGVVDREAMRIEPVAWHGVGEEFIKGIRLGLGETQSEGRGIAARAIVERKPMIAVDMTQDPRVLQKKLALQHGLHSLIVLPLLVADEAVGVLALYAGEVGLFDAEEIKLLTELAGNIAFAFAQIEKTSKLGSLTRVNAMLSGINGAIVRIRDRKELFEEACRIAVETGGLPCAWLGLVDESNMRLQLVASAGCDDGFLQTIRDRLSVRDDAPEERGLSTRAIREGRPIVVNDVAADAVLRHRQAFADRGIKSVAILPLFIADRTVGAFALHAEQVGFFDSEELKLLNEMAGNIAFAIDHIAKQEQLDYLAYYDALTGLANRRLFLERLAQYQRSALGDGHKLALYLIDLERFKNINDSLGRPAGDALLRQVAEWLTRIAGDANLLARLDADQFAAVLPKIRQESGVARLLEKWMKTFLDHSFRLNDAEFRIALKVGVAVFPDDGADAESLFRNAEAALKKAKASGDRYLFHTQKMTDMAAGKLSLENQLRQALDKGEFVLHYQPKVNLESGKLTGAEALIRWNDPRTGLVPPGRFIPILEETGLIYDVGRWALRQAIEDYRRWLTAGMPAVRIAVNVSPLQLRDRGFIEEITQVIGVDANAASGLELEITESLIMADVNHSIASLRAIRAMGVTIAIDDFGTGFSSLSYLAKLPVDTLKIDRSFVNDMTVTPQGLALVSTIIQLAHSLKLKAVAEGVETEEQSRLLRLLRCNEMQGFLFSKPVPGEIFGAKFLALPPAHPSASSA